LLDVGCGTGGFLAVTKKRGWTGFGIEPNVQARNIGNKKTDDRIFDVNKLLEFDAESFDVITLWHVLEHLPNLEDQISLLKKLLKANGTLIIAVPNHNSFDARHYNEYWAAYDVPRHLWHFNKKSVSKLFIEFSLEFLKTKLMNLVAFYVIFLSENLNSVKLINFTGFGLDWF